MILFLQVLVLSNIISIDVMIEKYLFCTQAFMNGVLYSTTKIYTFRSSKIWFYISNPKPVIQQVLLFFFFGGGGGNSGIWYLCYQNGDLFVTIQFYHPFTAIDPLRAGTK